MPRRLLLFAVVGLLWVPLSSQVPAPGALDGVWEGEMRGTRRPFILTVDFGRKIVELGGAGSGTLVSLEQPAPGSIALQAMLGAQGMRLTGKVDGRRAEGNVDFGTGPLPFWLERLPHMPEPRSREERWQQDLDTVLTRVLPYDHSFTPAMRSEARRQVDAIRKSLTQASDQAVMVALARVMAISGNAHTRLYLVRNRTEVRRLPIRAWWFGNEFRVVRAMPDHANLLGCRVLYLGGMNIGTAATRVRGIKAGNDSWQRYMSAYLLTSPDILFGAGVIRDPEQVEVRVQCGDDFRRVPLKPLPLRLSSNTVEAWWDLVPSYTDPNAEWLSALSVAQAPRYLRRAVENYWFEYVPADRLLYFQYNRSQQAPQEPMKAFITRMDLTITEHRPLAVIVDVRFNTGGDLGIATPLVEAIAPKLKGIPVVVLTGRSTFSAGITHAAQWKQFAGAKIVGEPAGDGLDMWSEGGNVVLPHSRLTAHYGNAFHSYSRVEHPERMPYFYDLSVDTLRPSVQVESSWADYMAGRDPAYEAAVRRDRTPR
jgi:hypothetical protein